MCHFTNGAQAAGLQITIPSSSAPTEHDLFKNVIIIIKAMH